MSLTSSSTLSPTMRYAACILLVVVGGGFGFCSNFLDDYLSLSRNRDSFYFDLLLSLIFFVVATVALVQSVYAIVHRPVNWQRMVCRVLFLVSVIASFWFQRGIASLEDRLFFWAREAHFKAKIMAKDPEATIVHMRSSVNFHKLIIFSGERPIAEGELSLNAVDSLGSKLSGLRGCVMDAESLWDGFYVVRAYC